MAKLLESIGKFLQTIFEPKNLWLIIFAIALFTLALLFIQNTPLADFFQISSFVNDYGKWIGPTALGSIALILAKIVIAVINLINDQFFA